MTRLGTAREGRRQVKRLGVTVSVVNYETQANTTRGMNYRETSESPKLIWAIPDPGGESVSLDTWGTDVSYDIVFIIRDDVAGITDGGDNRASEVIHNDDRFVVNKTDDYLNAGQRVLACESEG